MSVQYTASLFMPTEEAVVVLVLESVREAEFPDPSLMAAEKLSEMPVMKIRTQILEGLSGIAV